MKTATKAALASFFLPGAGLYLIGEHRQAVVNFLLAVVVGAVALATQHEHFHYAFLVIAAGSAGYAHAVAGRREDRSVATADRTGA